MTRNNKPATNHPQTPGRSDRSPARTDAERRLWHALRDHPGSAAKQLAATAGIGRSTATKTLTRWAADGHLTRTPADPAAAGPHATSTWTLPTDADRPGTGRQRLRPGELRTAVADYLAAPQRHGTSYTPGHIARALGRSAGAVTNALDRLTTGGTVAQTSDHPRRYTHTPAATTNGRSAR